jgi:hypothetical protein
MRATLTVSSRGIYSSGTTHWERDRELSLMEMARHSSFMLARTTTGPSQPEAQATASRVA